MSLRCARAARSKPMASWLEECLEANGEMLVGQCFSFSKGIAKGGLLKNNKGGCKRLFAFVHACSRLLAFVFSQPQSITQKGVHAHLVTAQEREHWFLQHLSHFLAANFGRQ